MSKLITVCIPTYNRDYFLGRCLRSILSQTFPKNLYEIIVVDDGSNDKTDLILNSFSKDVIIFKNKKINSQNLIKHPKAQVFFKVRFFIM